MKTLKERFDISSSVRSTKNIFRLLSQRPILSSDSTDQVLSFEEFYTELKHLGIDARYFEWWEYRDALADHLNVAIEVKFVHQRDEPILAMLLTQEGRPGLLFRDEQTGDALILVSGHLADPATLQVIYHELGHVAGGHQSYKKFRAGQYADCPDVSYSGIAGKTSKAGHIFYESDARLRAEYALEASHYGREDYRTDDWLFW